MRAWEWLVAGLVALLVAYAVLILVLLVLGRRENAFDLVPDSIPVVGYLDDALVVLLALRLVSRMMGPEQLEAHWPGPGSSLRAVLRLAGAST